MFELNIEQTQPKNTYFTYFFSLHKRFNFLLFYKLKIIHPIDFRFTPQ